MIKLKPCLCIVLMVLSSTGKHGILCAQTTSVNAASSSETHFEERLEMTYAFTIHPDLPVCHFRVLRNPDEQVRTVFISTAPDVDIVDQIISTEIGDLPYDKENYLKGIDVNFDGYLDLCLLDWWAARGNCQYFIWLFYPDSNIFFFSEAFSALQNPVFDPEKKQIISRNSSGPHDWTKLTYRLQAGEPLLIREETESLTETKEQVIKTIRTRKNGVMQDYSRIVSDYD